MSTNDNSNWVFDYGLIEDIAVPGGDLPSLDPPPPLWSSHNSYTDTASLRYFLVPVSILSKSTSFFIVFDI